MKVTPWQHRIGPKDQVDVDKSKVENISPYDNINAGNHPIKGASINMKDKTRICVAETPDQLKDLGPMAPVPGDKSKPAAPAAPATPASSAPATGGSPAA